MRELFAVTNRKPVVGFEGSYEISDKGEVFSLPRVIANGRRIQGRELTPYETGLSGHLAVDLSTAGIVYKRRIHRLVLEAFVGPCPTGYVACHWDGNPKNNNLDNLRWATVSDNAFDSVRHGTHNHSGRSSCVRGHLFVGENLNSLGGRRQCKSCARARARIHHYRKTDPNYPTDPSALADQIYEELIQKMNQTQSTYKEIN